MAQTGGLCISWRGSGDIRPVWPPKRAGVAPLSYADNGLVLSIGASPLDYDSYGRVTRIGAARIEYVD